MNTKMLERVFPIYAQIIAGQIGVHVQIGGDNAYCGAMADSNTSKLINLPALPLDDAKIAAAGWGFLYHEGFHAKYSSLPVLSQVAGKPLRKSLLHIVEDIWNEHHMPTEFLSSKVYIDAMNRYILDKGWFTPAKADDHPSTVLVKYVLYWGLGYHNNTDFLMPLADESENVLRSLLSPGAMTKLNAVLNHCAPTITCTEDSLALVDRIVDLLEEEDQDMSDQMNQPDAGDQQDFAGDDSDDDDQQSDGSPDSDADDQGDQGSAGDTDDSGSHEDAANSQSADGSDESPGDDQSSGSPSDDSGTADPSSSKSSSDGDDGDDTGEMSVIQQMLNATDDQLPEHHLSQFEEHMEEEAASAAASYRVAKPAPSEACPTVKNRGSKAFKNAQLHSDAVRKELQRIIESQQRNRQRLRDHGNRMCQRRMTNALFGNSEVFVHQRYQRQKTAAIHLLLDASPSMNSRIDMAIEATMSIGLAIERLRGVNLAVTRFPVDQRYGNVMYDDDVQPLISSGESIAANVDRFDIGTMGGTPMADAMWYCIHQLCAQKEDRKILLIVTDGQPSNEESVKELMKTVQPAGIEVLALGIREESVKRLFPVAESINDINQLSNALFQMVGTALLKTA